MGRKPSRQQWVESGQSTAYGMTMMLLFLLLQIAAASANTPCVPFDGGPADGMCPGSIAANGDDFQLVRLLPATRTGAPIDPQVSSTLSTLLEDQRMGIPIERKLLASGATGEFCEEFSDECFSPKPLQAWPLGKDFVSNPPYGLPDGRVRIEWMRNGRLEFLSFVSFAGAKVKDLSTAPAKIPVKANS